MIGDQFLVINGQLPVIQVLLPVDLLEDLEDLDEEVDDVEVELDGRHDVLLGAHTCHDHLYYYIYDYHSITVGRLAPSATGMFYLYPHVGKV